MDAQTAAGLVGAGERKWLYAKGREPLYALRSVALRKIFSSTNKMAVS